MDKKRGYMDPDELEENEESEESEDIEENEGSEDAEEDEEEEEKEPTMTESRKKDLLGIHLFLIDYLFSCWAIC